MSNNLSYFPHEINAHDDSLIKKSMARFGHFGYSSYFIILELIYSEGVGDTITISQARLCSKLSSRRGRVREFLEFLRNSTREEIDRSQDEPRLNPGSSLGSSKVEFEWSQDEVRIQIKNVRERLKKIKFKSSAKVPEKFPNGSQTKSLNLKSSYEANGEGREGVKSSMLNAQSQVPQRGLEDLQNEPDGSEPKTETSAPPAQTSNRAGAENETTAKELKRKGTPLLEQKDPAAKLLGHHCKHFLETMGVAHRPKSFSKDIKMAGELLQDYEFSKAVRLNALFFQELKDDEWVRKQGYSFFAFTQRINAMAVILKDKTPSLVPSRSGPPLGFRRSEATIGDETHWEEWDGSRWVYKSVIKKSEVTS